MSAFTYYITNTFFKENPLSPFRADGSLPKNLLITHTETDTTPQNTSHLVFGKRYFVQRTPFRASESIFSGKRTPFRASESIFSGKRTLFRASESIFSGQRTLFRVLMLYSTHKKSLRLAQGDKYFVYPVKRKEVSSASCLPVSCHSEHSEESFFYYPFVNYNIMNIIKKLDAKSLRNNEHFQFSTEFKSLVMKHNPEMLKVKPLFDDYCKAYAEEDEAMLVVRKSAVSEEILNADARRDNDFRGFVDAVKAAQKHFNPQVVVAAKKVKILLDTTGNVIPMGNDQETSKIYNLIQELRSPAYSSEIALMKLEDWVAQLEEANQAFETLTRQRIEEVSQRTLLKVKETRIAVDEQYKNLITRIESYLNIGEEVPAYSKFIPELNTLIDNYRHLLAQRQGRVDAKKEKEDGNNVAG